MLNLPFKRARNFPSAQKNFEAIALKLIPELVTSLPTDPYKGQVIFYDTGTEGVVWQLRYNSGSASSSKWEYVGGPPLFAEVTTASNTASTTYVDLGGPDIALPEAGDYDVRVECSVNPNTSNDHGRMSYAIGVTTASDNDMADSRSLGGEDVFTMSTARRKTGLTAVTLAARYRVTGGNADFTRRHMWVHPVRLGS